MRYKEITEMHSVTPIKPLTPSQARLEALKKQKERAGTALDAERKRQKVSKAQENLKKAVSA
jgi:hypothetical protein